MMTGIWQPSVSRLIRYRRTRGQELAAVLFLGRGRGVGVAVAIGDNAFDLVRVAVVLVELGGVPDELTDLSYELVEAEASRVRALG